MSLPFHPENVENLTPAEKALNPENPQFWNRRYASKETLKLRSEVMKSVHLSQDIVEDANTLVEGYLNAGIHWTSLRLASDLAKKNANFSQMATDTLEIIIVP